MQPPLPESLHQELFDVATFLCGVAAWLPETQTARARELIAQADALLAERARILSGQTSAPDRHDRSNFSGRPSE